MIRLKRRNDIGRRLKLKDGGLGEVEEALEHVEGDVPWPAVEPVGEGGEDGALHGGVVVAGDGPGEAVEQLLQRLLGGEHQAVRVQHDVREAVVRLLGVQPREVRVRQQRQQLVDRRQLDLAAALEERLPRSKLPGGEHQLVSGPRQPDVLPLRCLRVERGLPGRGARRQR